MSEPCASTNVETREDLTIVKTGWIDKQYVPKIAYGGTIRHRCVEPEEGHPGNCHCECGRTWVRNYK